MFLPATRKEMRRLGWSEADVILITGDAYIDSPFIGAAIIGKVLVKAGYRVGIIAQPDVESDRDIGRLGEPRLFWGVTAGCMDSMIANYTASGKRRRKDDLTPGGENLRRPNRALIAYCGLIRRYFKETRPIVIGGLEASLRRISHYDSWQNRVRRSVLFDARADILAYGMAEKTVAEIADRLKCGLTADNIRGTCVIGENPDGAYIELPSHECTARDRNAFQEMFLTIYSNTDPLSARGLCQKQDTRYLIQHPPQRDLNSEELDALYEMDFERDVHPFDRAGGRVPGNETIRFSVTTHRGCFGQCDFCSITAHQGRAVISRSPDSIIREVRRLTSFPDFKGIIPDVGGPTANMYGMTCGRIQKKGACRDRRCLTPEICPKLKTRHGEQTALLRRLRSLPGVQKVFIGSGLRHDLVMHDARDGDAYLKEIIKHHISGQLKLAPEHCSDEVLSLMGKPGISVFSAFKEKFDRFNRRLDKKQFITCYFIAAYPGCTREHMREIQTFARRVLKFQPEQVQIFTPSPSTIATLMYYTGIDPRTGASIFVEWSAGEKEIQKRMVTGNHKRGGRRKPGKHRKAREPRS